MSETDSITERELAQQLFEEVFSGKPKSVGEALAASEPEAPSESPETSPSEPEPPAEPPVVVSDTPEETPRETPEAPPEPPTSEPEPEEEGQPEGQEEPEDANVAWAIKKYGEDSAKWAKAAFDYEQITTRLGNEKRALEEERNQWVTYAQGLEQQTQQVQRAAMPLSSQEEQWIEQAQVNPYGYAMQAIQSGAPHLAQAIVNSLAEENPQMAMQVDQQIRMGLAQQEQQMAMQAAAMEPTSEDMLSFMEQNIQGSIDRLGIDIPTYGEAMLAKFNELGINHPYMDAIYRGDDQARELALLAVLDLVRSGTTTTRRVAETEREQQIRREAELRKEAAGVVTGAPHVNSATPQQPAMLDAMEEEWKRRGQWAGE